MTCGQRPFGPAPGGGPAQRHGPDAAAEPRPHGDGNPWTALPSRGGAHRLDPEQETGFKLLCIPHSKDPTEGVVRGNAMGQVPKRLPSTPFALPKPFHVYPDVGPADDAEEGDEQDGGQRMAAGARIPRIVDRFHEGHPRPIRKRSVSSRSCDIMVISQSYTLFEGNLLRWPSGKLSQKPTVSCQNQLT